MKRRRPYRTRPQGVRLERLAFAGRWRVLLSDQEIGTIERLGDKRRDWRFRLGDQQWHECYGVTRHQALEVMQIRWREEIENGRQAHRNGEVGS